MTDPNSVSSEPRGRRASLVAARWLGISLALLLVWASPGAAQGAASPLPSTTIIAAGQVDRHIQILGSAIAERPSWIEIAVLGGLERGLTWERSPVDDRGVRPLGWRVNLKVPLVDGKPLTILARAVDESGVSDPSPAVFTVVADGVAPSVVRLDVEGGALATNRRFARVRATVRGATKMRWAPTARDLEYAAWAPFASELSVPLTPGDGIKPFAFQFADSAGNVSDPRDGLTSALVDRTPPNLVLVQPVRGGVDVYFDEAVGARSQVRVNLTDRPVLRPAVATARRDCLHIPLDGLTSGERYTFALPADCGIVDMAQNQAAPRKVEFQAMDEVPPSAPRSVVATSQDGLVRLDWPPASDDVTVSLFRVYRSSTPMTGRPGPESAVGDVGGLAFVDDSGISNATYHYSVTAVDSSGNESTIAPQVSVRVGIKGLYHGEETQNTNLCKDCHGATVDAGLTPAQAERRRCYSCHDGTGSRFNAEGEFGEGAAGATPTSAHPVTDDRLRCGSCHTAHRSPLQVPRLLAVRAPDGTRVEGGPRYCLVCHYELPPGSLGATARVNSAAYRQSGHASLPVAGGTGVSCSACHSNHGSAQPALLARPQTSLCLGCHDGDGARGPLGWDVAAQFSGRSHHAVDGTTTDGLAGVALGCSSCHDAHLARRGEPGVSDPSARLIDPAADSTETTAWTGPQGDITGFCLSCHGRTGGRGASAASRAAFPVVDAVRFALFPGWDKSAYPGSAHGTGTVLAPGERQCTACHQVHGSDNPRTLIEPEDTTATAGMCLKCHNGTRPDVADVATAFAKPSRHPTLDRQGVHADVEGPQELGYNGGMPDMRHAECQDCHEPHQAARGRHAPGSASAGPALDGVAGVGVARWPDAAMAGPAQSDLESTRLASGTSEEWQLCFKCHSNYTSLPQTADTETVPRDVAAEFNPNNPSYHAVVAGSRSDTRTAFVSGSAFGPKSRMTCTDCHGTDDTSVGVAAGPHGSNNAPLLVRPFNDRTGLPGTDGDLCFSCHDRAVYGGDDDRALDMSRTAFADAARNLHDIGRPGEGHRVACVSCHSRVAHGARLRALLVSAEETAPYRAVDSPGVTLTAGMPEPGQWSIDSCAHEGACHR